MHQNTKLCVDKAESLIEEGDGDSLRYACLELRMAIEYLFYDLLPLYADEIPTDMAKRWQPQRVIDVLTDCDPYVQNDCRIALGNHDSGVPVVLESKGVSKGLIKSYWHKLGSFLHASMTGAKAVGTDEVPFLWKTISALREYEESRVRANVAARAELQCICGRTIKRNVEALKTNSRVRCPDDECRMIWDWVGEGDGEVRFKPARKSFICPGCQAINFYDERFAFDGLKVTCGNCEARVLLSLSATVADALPLDGTPNA